MLTTIQRVWEDFQKSLVAWSPEHYVVTCRYIWKFLQHVHWHIWAWTDSFFFCARAGMTGMFKKDIIRIAVNHKCRYAANGKEGNKSENMSCNQLIGIVGTPPFLREWMPLVSFPPSKTNFFNIHSRLFYLLRDNKLVVVFFCNCTEESQIGKSQLLVWWYNKMEKRK